MNVVDASRAAGAASDAPAADHDRRWPKRFAVVTAVVVVVAAILAVVYAHHYQPIGAAGFAEYAPVGPPTVKSVSDGLGHDSWVVVGPRGTTGTVGYTLRNNGRFDIRLEPADGDDRVSYRWAPTFLPDGQSGSRPPELADSRSLPMTWHAHQTIQLFVTVTKPPCAPHLVSVIEQLRLRWSALLVHHETWLPLTAEAGSRPPIGVCFPRSTLKHVS